MRVRIDDRNDDGRGRGKADGRVALISQAHPGEEITLRVDRTTRGTIQGRVGKFIVRSDKRIEHRCPHEFHCTGCPLLAADTAEESSFKVEKVRAVLNAAGIDPNLELTLETPSALFGYRHLAKQIFTRRGPHLVLGSFVSGTHKVVDNRGCPVLAPALRTVMDALASAAESRRMPVHEASQSQGLRHAVARLSRATGEVLLTVVTSEDPPHQLTALLKDLRRAHPAIIGAAIAVKTGDDNVLLDVDVRTVLGRGDIEEEMLGFRHHIGIRSFFQINPLAAQRLFELACEFAGSGALAIDAYAGVGALSFPLTRNFSRVVAIESEETSAAALAAARPVDLGPERLLVVTARVETELVERLQRETPDVVVLDPPRAGAGPVVMQALASSSLPRVVLLSCDPDALGRDLPALLAAKFTLRRIVAVNQFPRTAHVETVAWLER